MFFYVSNHMNSSLQRCEILIVRKSFMKSFTCCTGAVGHVHGRYLLLRLYFIYSLCPCNLGVFKKYVQISRLFKTKHTYWDASKITIKSVNGLSGLQSLNKKNAFMDNYFFYCRRFSFNYKPSSGRYEEDGNLSDSF